MTYEDKELSIDNGQPIDLITFTLGEYVWRYTTCDVPVTIGGNVFQPAAMRIDNIKQTGEARHDALSVDVPSWVAPAQMYMSAAPSRPIIVQIGSTHLGMVDEEVIIAYNGEVTQVNFPIPGRAIITCESLMSSLAREGLRLAWQRSCPYALYDPVNCKVPKANYATAFFVLGIDGDQIMIDSAGGQVDGYFTGGFLEWQHPVRGTEFIAIERHVKVVDPLPGSHDNILLAFTAPGELYEGASGLMYPGCNFTPTMCQERFNNYGQYGGVPDLPGKSPFDGTNPFF